MIIIVSTAVLAIFCINSSSSKHLNQQKQAIVFKFENYRTPEEARKQLSYIFPKGTQLNKLISTMKAIGAKCYDAQTDEESHNSIYCHYTEAGFFVHNTWIVGVEVDNNKKVLTLSVERGYTGT